MKKFMFLGALLALFIGCPPEVEKGDDDDDDNGAFLPSEGTWDLTSEDPSPSDCVPEGDDDDDDDDTGVPEDDGEFEIIDVTEEGFILVINDEENDDTGMDSDPWENPVCALDGHDFTCEEDCFTMEGPGGVDFEFTMCMTITGTFQSETELSADADFSSECVGDDCGMFGITFPCEETSSLTAEFVE
jgi:hypothetical protein